MGFSGINRTDRRSSDCLPAGYRRIAQKTSYSHAGDGQLSCITKLAFEVSEGPTGARGARLADTGRPRSVPGRASPPTEWTRARSGPRHSCGAIDRALSATAAGVVPQARRPARGVFPAFIYRALLMG